ncbi:MAG: glycosyl hydrolase, partial [Chloroflexota bacterium]
MAKSLKPRLVLLLMILAGFIYPTFSPVSSAASVDKLSASTLQLGVNLHPLQPPEAPTGQIPKQVNLLPNMGASIVRIDLKWAWIEPFGPGSNNWNPDPIDRLNTFLNAMSGNNIEIVATVDSTPCWASTLPKKDCNPNTINYPPANLQDYTNFLSELVKRYKTKIKYWEIWNEPNLPDFWATPDPEGYTALLKAAYSAVKAADPSAIVIGGALAPRNDPIDTLTYLDRMYSAGAKGYFDKLSYHPYTDGNTPTWYDKLWPMMSYSSSVPAIRQHMQNFNDSVPIWLTEIGWTTVPPSQCSDCWTPVLPKTEDEQAAYMVEAINIAKTWNYVETFIWYKLIDTISPFNPSKISYEHYFGLFRKDYTAKPAVVQFRMLATTPPVSNNPVYKHILSDFYNVWKQSD